jgi:hypothetical protein
MASLCEQARRLEDLLLREEESSRFLEKAAQKLLFMLGHGHCRRRRP